MLNVADVKTDEDRLKLILDLAKALFPDLEWTVVTHSAEAPPVPGVFPGDALVVGRVRPAVDSGRRRLLADVWRFIRQQIHDRCWALPGSAPCVYEADIRQYRDNCAIARDLLSKAAIEEVGLVAISREPK